MGNSVLPARRRYGARSLGRLVAAAMAAAAATGVTFLPPSDRAAAVTARAPLVWSTLSPPVTPPPLAYSSAAYDSDNRTVVLFGGVTPSGALSNSTWVWDGSNWKVYAGSQIVSPGARELASMSFDPVLHQLVLFGGRTSGGEALGDTWAWNGASWYQVSQGLSGQSPSPREGAAMAYDGHGNLVLFGGDGPPAGGETGTGGTAGSSTAGSPAAGSPTTGPSTADRAAVPATTSVPSGSALADTWLWGADGWVKSSAAGPGARTSASLAYNSASGTAVLFGGSSSPIASGSPGRLSDTWTWNGSAWSPAPTPQPAGTVGAGAAPGPRFGSLAADDPQAGGVVLFGGSGPDGVLDDIWIWDGRAWSGATASGSPGPRAGAGGAYDFAGGQFLLFGGAGNAYAGGTADAKGNYGSTIGGAARVLDGTFALTAGGPVGLGTPLNVLPPTVDTTPGSSLPPGAAPRASAGSGTQPAAGPRAANSAAARAVASPLQVLHPGQLVTLRGSGFLGSTKVTVTFHSTPVVVGTTKAGAGGTFDITVAVPQSAAAGIHRFLASGTGPKGPVQLVVATVKVLAGSPGPGRSTGTVERAALLGLAVAIPGVTWLAMGLFSRRSRGQPASG